jgi:hypothetical protein
MKVIRDLPYTKHPLLMDRRTCLETLKSKRESLTLQR